MIIGLSNLVSMWKIQRKTFFQTRSERLIIIYVKEYINRPPLWKRSIHKQVPSLPLPFPWHCYRNYLTLSTSTKRSFAFGFSNSVLDHPQHLVWSCDFPYLKVQAACGWNDHLFIQTTLHPKNELEKMHSHLSLITCSAEVDMC